MSEEQVTPSVEASPVPEKSKKFAFLVRMKDKCNSFFESRYPKKGFAITVVVAWVILIGLGSWQMVRLTQKNHWINDVRAKLSEPTNLQTKIWPRDRQEWLAMEYEPMAIQGTWLPLFRFKLVPRTYEGQVGYHLLVPLRLQDRQVVLVNRGFIPDGQAILPPLENEEVIIQGVARVPESEKPWQTPENIPSRNIWTWLDLPALQHEIGVDEIAPIVLYEARHPEHNEFPIGGQLPVVTHNRHANYALTWYSLSLALLLISLAASKRTTHSETSAESNKISDPVAERGLYPEATD